MPFLVTYIPTGPKIYMFYLLYIMIFSYISSYIQIALETMLLIILIVDICSGSFIFTYILVLVCVIFIGASLSEPHTSQLNGAIFISESR